MPASSRLAQLIAHNEGFGITGAIPTERHNPGDLRHSPHASHAGIGANDIGEEPSDDVGWSDLERQLNLYAERGFTLRELAYAYAPPADNNPTEAYLDSLCKGLGLPDSTPVADALKVTAV